MVVLKNIKNEKEKINKCKYLALISKRQEKLNFFRCLKKGINIHISDCYNCEFFEKIETKNNNKIEEKEVEMKKFEKKRKKKKRFKKRRFKRNRDEKIIIQIRWS